MRRFVFFLVFALMLLGMSAVARPALAANCYLDQNGVHVCDARRGLTPFSTPGYVYGSIFFSTNYSWIEDHAYLYEQPDPGARVVDQLGVGLLYSTIDGTATDAQGNTWYMVRDRYWVQAKDVHMIEESNFTGVEVNLEPERPFGWVLQPFRPSSEPGVVAPEDTPWVRRYTFIEIYDAAEGDDGWIWYNIGDGRWVKEYYLALVDVSERPEGVGEREFWVGVDLSQQIFTAYEGDRMVYAGLVSTGLEQWPTNEGLFTVWARKLETPMYGGELGVDYYFLEDVPHTLFFDEDIALHGAYWHDEFGVERSHGCVNMTPRDAEWVFFWSENAPNELWVHVYASDPDHFLTNYRQPLVNNYYFGATAQVN